ncbi:hypothetical protein, partial [Janthinobacterium sp. 35]|uniref:hypothetical protein n=1 Tax=Janthinobacterium sp. 35 TaxID=2035210 RepID=UPI001C557C6A
QIEDIPQDHGDPVSTSPAHPLLPGARRVTVGEAIHATIPIKLVTMHLQAGIMDLKWSKILKMAAP